LRRLVAELGGRGPKVDYRSVWEFVHAEKLSFKKSVVAGERDRPDVARRRLQWTKYQDRVEPERLVFIDETWTRTDMAPLRGWASRGHRLTAKVPHGRWKTMTFLAALRHDRIDAPWFIVGPIDGESFRTYVAKVLLPTLRPGDIVVLDNLGSHRGKAVRQLIRSVGAKLFFLPKYSPDLSPIEQVFAKLKHLIRKAAARTVDAVCAAIGDASLHARRMRQLSQKFRLSNLISSLFNKRQIFSSSRPQPARFNSSADSTPSAVAIRTMESSVGFASPRSISLTSARRISA
jgi:transposase